MAFDSSPTRNHTILTLAFSSMAILFALHFVLKSYFISMTEGAKRAVLKSPDALIKLREKEKEAFEKAQTSLEQAKSKMMKGRQNAAAFLVPLTSSDDAAMKGWNQIPKAFSPERRELLPPPPVTVEPLPPVDLHPTYPSTVPFNHPPRSGSH